MLENSMASVTFFMMTDDTWTNTGGGFHSVVVGNDCKELYERHGLVCDHKRIDGKQQLAPLTLPQCVKSLGIFMNSNGARLINKVFGCTM